MSTSWPLLAPPPVEVVRAGGEPTFSVLIAAYQAAAFIADAIESVLRQTTPAHEIIVCDDGSSDDLDGALAPYQDEIVFVRQENRGEGAAKNTAAQNASGDFVVFLDADDTYLPERLEALRDTARLRPDLDILVTDAHIQLDGRTVRRAYDETWPFEVADQRRGILERNFVLGHAAVRRDRFASVGGFDDSMRIVADWDLWIRIILGGARAGLITRPLACYRVHAGSLSTETERIMRGGIRCLEQAAARDDLTADERKTVARTLAKWNRDLRLSEAREALRTEAAGRRAKLLRVARDGGYGWQTRVKAALAAALPRRAGTTLAAREATSFMGAAGMRVDEAGPRPDEA